MSVERLRWHPGHLVLQLSQQARRISAAVGEDGPHVSVPAERVQSAELPRKACAHHEARH